MADAQVELFLGSSVATARVRAAIVKAARVDASVLISGESGVGKQLWHADTRPLPAQC